MTLPSLREPTSNTKRAWRFASWAVAVWMLAAPVAGHAATATPNLVQQEKDLKAALSANPNDADAHIKLGQIYIEQGRWNAAEAEAQAARRDGVQRDDADALLAWALFLENRPNLLFTQVKPGEREPHAESIVRLSLGLSHLKPLELDSAEPFLRDAVRLDPKAWRARIALADYLILRRKLPEAREQMDAARALAPEEVGVIRIGAHLKRAEGDTDGAIADLSKVIAVHPSFPALTARADALISQDKLSEALQDVESALQIVSNPQAIFLHALILARQGKMTAADQRLTRASRTFDHIRIGYYLLGVVKFWLDLPETAEFYLSKFQVQQPNVSGPVRLRAMLAIRRKDVSSAIQLLKPVVETNPADQDAVTLLARAYIANSQPEQVVQLYQQVTAAPPPDPAAVAVDSGALLMVYGDAVGDLVEVEKVIMRQAPAAVPVMASIRQGDIARASAMADALAAATPDDALTQSVVGSVRLAQKRWADAEAIFRRIVEKRPGSTSATLQLTEALVAQKQLDEARSLIRDLTRRGPNDE